MGAFSRNISKLEILTNSNFEEIETLKLFIEVFKHTGIYMNEMEEINNVKRNKPKLRSVRIFRQIQKIKVNNGILQS